MLHQRGVSKTAQGFSSPARARFKPLPSFDVVVGHGDAPYGRSQQHEEGSEEERRP